MSKHAEQFGCGSLLSQVLPHKYSLTPGCVGVTWIHAQNQLFVYSLFVYSLRFCSLRISLGSSRSLIIIIIYYGNK